MRRVVIVTLLTTMCGCGSCLDDKKVPEAEQVEQPVGARYGTGDGGMKRRLGVGPSVGFAGVLKKDAATEDGGP